MDKKIRRRAQGVRFPTSVDFYPEQYVDGRPCTATDSSVVGFCAFYQHLGFLDERLLAQHQCLEKKCQNLERNYNSRYWEHQANRKLDRMAAKREKKAREQLELGNIAYQDKVREVMQRWADDVGYEIQIVRVSCTEKGHKVFYVSDTDYDDWADYPVLVEMGNANLPQHGIYLKRIRMPDGSLATREQYRLAKKSS